MSFKTLALGGAGFGGLIALAVLPALIAPPAPASVVGGCGPTVGASVAVIAATIRQLESGGDYTARAPGSSASGAYQFIDESWADYSGYARAWLAPPAVQDAKAAENINAVLAAHDHDVSLVPVAWYIGHVPAAGSPEWDIVPAPSAGNRLTPREYQTKWMAEYRSQLAAPENTAPAPTESPGTAVLSPCRGETGPLLADGWALPGPRDLLQRTADQLGHPHHDAPAWDWAIPIGTPVFAIRGGTVVATTDSPYNCAGHKPCDDCGLGLTISDTQNVQWTYCHGSARPVARGDVVAAGQQILTSGNTGNSTGPHVHIAIRINGVAHCPQPLMVSLAQRGIGLDPSTLPTAGCTY